METLALLLAGRDATDLQELVLLGFQTRLWRRGASLWVQRASLYARKRTGAPLVNTYLQRPATNINQSSILA